MGTEPTAPPHARLPVPAPPPTPSPRPSPAYPNCTLASGDKSKIFIYNRVLLNAKGECNYFQPVFSSNDFKGADRAEDTDSLLDQIYQEFNAGNARFADDMKVEFPVVGKTDKAGMFDLFSKFR